MTVIDPTKRIVTEIPLKVLWNLTGELEYCRGPYIGRERIVEAMRRGSVAFCVANVGDALRWIRWDDVYRFWKTEVRPCLFEPAQFGTGVRREDFPGERYFLASEWYGQGEEFVVLLELYH